MTNAFNKSIIEGRAVRVPALKQTRNNIPYCNLIIAVHESFMSEGQLQQKTSYISVAIWNKTAQACCMYIKKGQNVRVEGKLRQSTWITDDGIKHSKLEINCESIKFLDFNKKSRNQTKKSVGINEYKVVNTTNETDWIENFCEADLQEI